MLQNTAVSHPLLHFSRSPIGKKLLTGITGSILAGFVMVHLLGNLTLLVSPMTFNRYAAGLENLKPLVWGIEGVLLLAIALHATLGIQIYLNQRKARQVAYENYKSVNQVAPKTSETQDAAAGPPSFQTASSRSMIWTGLALALFVVWHLATFKFGPRYEIMLEGEPARDLARLVIETFQQSSYTFSYLGIISLLGVHLRHGLWSALQSLGALGKGMQGIAFGIAGIMAIAIAVGYWLVPLAIYAGLIS